MTRLGSLHHLALCVSDIERAERFYTPVLTALGFEMPRFTPRGVCLYTGPAGAIGLWPQRHNPPNTPHDLYSPGLHHLCFAADSRDDVDRLYETLVSMDATILNAPAEYDYMPGYYAVFFADPDGLKLELACPPSFPKA